MIVCQCGVVSDRAVVRAIEAGAQSVSQVCRATGAGQTCGTCLFSVRRLVCQHGQVMVPSVPEVEVAAS